MATKVLVIGRVAAQQLGRSRVGSAIIRAAGATGRSFSRILHQLWLEVTGFTFLVIAGIGALAGVREYHKYQADEAGPGKVILAACLAALFAWFGLSSFWRVRKKAKA
jgi:uncharacterized membrane protein YbhN (UPF0104 family)